MIESILKENEINIFDVNAEYSVTHLPNMIMTSTAQYLKEQGENVIYFPLNQTFKYSLEEIEAISLARRLELGVDLISYINEYFNLGIREWDLKEIKKDHPINSGALRIINYLATVYAEPKNSIVMINKYDQGLHPAVKDVVMKFILKIGKPKYLIVTSYGDHTFQFDKIGSIDKLSEALKESLKKEREK